MVNAPKTTPEQELASLRLRCGIEPPAIEGDVFHVLDKTRAMLRAEQQSHAATGAERDRLMAENEALRRSVPLDAIERGLRRAGY